jgi:hypothetical protein
MVPEFYDELVRLSLYTNFKATVQEAMNEYYKSGPYWFVSRYDAAIAEGTMEQLYDYPAMFSAKAWILKESREELTKWLDVPAFKVGDLFYIQNVVAAIEAPSSGPTSTPGPSPTSAPPTPTTSPACKADLNGDHTVNQLDLSLILQNFSTTTSIYDINGDGKVNMLDAVYILKNWGGSC